ncbi:50S ribosomal protein L35 [candidate division WOR-1 bacterium RIFOXYA12_FULL_52_29]|uniref:Large ribosomal subunit protein bL35 n=1 Tax=candidate division WOR-1 bacterium RIFOXYC12_FULL_54_18 TaxID=1802584 RepID=A0A1F4T778_UNCSA|nr:MAG: 50S ribosomal protein L35 [candidate division WOR-1 bacterium RIFOXYA2_FULL_51_19]OGC17962.1 MAG: 50S ribosomal protein L35 [candidate division WOR-1 bacterium RIFOXYA12_FULL_52_29]OGC26819.1 MAG: 50S ribosomal protein L35 [candidate division WOR-1 bacterium RIFOXYB2_FULL_45_9]OGC28379.1 MAG: 50S ribosomal protein L35 [candidate division WOR-1 bacterium RIFOXYC12_FULL_54_18]OGC31165.1 MAG: 50S ribosomal protein L35 [candidate division WOR-1 bacterium RIFOXYB12_FULL_52_16]
MQKTRKAAAKRFEIKKSGKILRRSSGLRHLLEWKSASKRRRLKAKKEVSPSDVRRIHDMLPGG